MKLLLQTIPPSTILSYALTDKELVGRTRNKTAYGVFWSYYCSQWKKLSADERREFALALKGMEGKNKFKPSQVMLQCGLAEWGCILLMRRIFGK